MKLDDDIKIGAIMQMVPGNLKEHLTLNMDSYDGYYQNVRLAVTNYIAEKAHVSKLWESWPQEGALLGTGRRRPQAWRRKRPDFMDYMVQ